MLRFIKAKQIATSNVFCGKQIRNTLGIAAGFDKNGIAISGLFALGFGFVEIGTVTPNPQSGNPSPRIFRYGKFESIINKMGFPSDGADAVLQRLLKFNKTKKDWQVVGVNIGKNHNGTEQDYATLIRIFHQHCDYIAINISSPNTQGLRDFMLPQNINNFLSFIKTTKEILNVQIPLLIKISPDLTRDELEILYLAARLHELDGIIASNTTISRPNSIGFGVAGGLSGKLMSQISFQTLQTLNQIHATYTSQHKEIKEFTIISSGGISSAEDASSRYASGANLIQIYTSLVYQGPSVISELLAPRI